MVKKKNKVPVIKKLPPLPNKPKEPEFMVQISDPQSLRKDILESLREVIIFMQGYDKFRQIQEQKVLMFNQLKSEVRGIQNLIDQRLVKNLPKGNLHSMKMKLLEEESEEKAPVAEVSVEKPKEEKKRPIHHSELEELEFQLKDIESQLSGMN